MNELDDKPNYAVEYFRDKIPNFIRDITDLDKAEQLYDDYIELGYKTSLYRQQNGYRSLLKSSRDSYSDWKKPSSPVNEEYVITNSDESIHIKVYNDVKAVEEFIFQRNRLSNEKKHGKLSIHKLVNGKIVKSIDEEY